MAEYAMSMRTGNPALDALAFCAHCRAIFLGIEAANDHEVDCEMAGRFP